MLLCECGEFIDGDTFKVYIETSINPSTPTIGHRKCGLILDFVDGNLPKQYSSKIELKSIAARFAEKKKMDTGMREIFLLEVHRIKSEGRFTDAYVLCKAFEKTIAVMAKN